VDFNNLLNLDNVQQVDKLPNITRPISLLNLKKEEEENP
jgi:hypothetical protein